MPKQDLALVNDFEQSDKNDRRIIERAKEKQRIYNARPYKRAKIDQKSVQALAKNMLPVEDMASILGCSPKLLMERYGQVIHESRNGTKNALAAVMFQKALVQGDSRMMVWLSKQHLGYKESWPDNMQPVSININVSDMP